MRLYFCIFRLHRYNQSRVFIQQEQGHGGNHLAHAILRRVWLLLSPLLFLSVLLCTPVPAAVAANPVSPPARLLTANASSSTAYAVLETTGHPAGLTGDLRRQWSRQTGIPGAVWTALVAAVSLLALVLLWNLHLRRTVASVRRQVKAGNAQVRESEELFAKAFAMSPAPMVIVDIDSGRFIDVNVEWLQLVEYSREETIGRTSFELGVWHDVEVRRRMVGRLRQTGSFHDEPVRFVAKSGAIKDVLWSAEIINLGGAEVMLSVIHDFTERKRAEDALRESESYNKVLFHDSHVPLAVIDPASGRFTDCNQAAVVIYGYADREEVIGLTPPDLSAPLQYDGRPSAEVAAERIAEAMEQGTTVFEWRHKRPNGELWDTVVHLITFQHGDNRLLQLSLQDITGRRQAEAEREQLQNQLLQAQKIESIGRLAGGVAHDFNNMLSVILGHTELAQQGLEPTHPLHARLRKVREAAQRSADLTRQLLAFARKQTAAPRVLDLNETVEGLLPMLRRLIGEDIDLVWNSGTRLQPVRMDPSQVDQILVNLCVNARDAISGAGRVTIGTETVLLAEAELALHPEARPQAYVVLCVGDTGCGMDTDTLSHLFEPFFTTKEVGRGTGLGLATVHGIVQQNEGFITVTSAPGRGSTFRLHLPRRQGEAVVRIGQETEERPPRGDETILLVEDEPMILEMARTMLIAQGYTVLAASATEEACDLAREHAGGLHLLVTDVVMPKMNGRELAEVMVALYPGLRVLFMSGYTDDVIAHHGVLDEGMQFIQKPFSHRDLAVKVREALDA